MSGDKTTITVDRDVALRCSKLARELGIPLQKLASDALRIVEEVMKDGGNATDLVLTWRCVKSITTVDTATLPINILLKIFEDLEPGKYVTDFYTSGKEIGVAMSNEITFADLVKRPYILKTLIPIRYANSKETESEITITLSVPSYVKKLTPLISAYIRGILDAYGYTQHKIDIKEHIIEIKIYKNIQT